MSNYYNKRDARVRIAHELMNRGWNVLGYKKDESDSMTDYYSPADWDGIAIKNGFVLCVDIKEYDVKYNSGKEIYKYNYNANISTIDYKKIEALKNMTVEKGCTEAEAENAKARIEAIYKNAENNREERENNKILEFVYPVFMQNPKGSIWHIEKDGIIYDKGNSLTKFADCPESYIYDLSKNCFTESYKYYIDHEWIDGERITHKKERTLSEKEQKSVIALQSFILKLERIVNSLNGMGDGTKETELKAMEQNNNDKMELVKKTIRKKVLKMVEVTNRKEIKIGDFLKFDYHGHFWKVTKEHMQNGTWKGIQETKKAFTYELAGSEKRGYAELKNGRRYYDYEFRLLKSIEEGKIKIFELKEVEEVTEVEKWVKVKAQKTTKKADIVNDYITTTQEQSTESQNELKLEYTITEDVDTRDNSPLWVVKIINKLSKEDYIKVSEQFKTIKGYYSKFKHGFIFKYNPLEKLNSCFNTEEKEIKSNSIKENNIKSSKTQEPKEKDYTKLINKINSQLETNNKKIEHLSGNYLTNTWKRIKEQENRDNQKESLVFDNSILNYLLNRINLKDITELEESLTVKTFRDDIHKYYRRHNIDFNKNPHAVGLKYPSDNLINCVDWAKEQYIKDTKRLQNANINNLTELIKAIEEYNIILDVIENRNPIDLKQQQIKKLEREYKMQQKGDINFTTNTDLLNQLIELADINNNDRILEPSAGIGNIADKLKEYTNNIDVCEFMYSYADLLKLKGFNVVENDFLKLNSYNSYDKIVANPPFSNEQEHIKHMFKMIKVNGKLVTITSNHWTFASDKKSIEFREWLNSLDYEVFDVDGGKFEFTNIPVKILVINKYEQEHKQAI